MTIRSRIQGPILEVTIDRPEAMNALDAAANAELGRVWRRFNADPALQVAILTGAGDKAFSAGADLKTLIPAYRAGALGEAEVDWHFGGGLARGLEIEKPIIAAVNGHCLAGGLEMALACDIRLCSPNATFGLAEVKWAIIPGAGGTQRLPRAVPLGLALEMILTGDPIDADEALRVGLVNRILPADGLMPAARALAGRIAARGPLAVRAAKRAALEGLAQGLAAGMELEDRLFREVAASEDAREGPLAFAEKRPPRFHGR
jgi:enoyl-CoA hydratase/carnithine racemase